MSCKARTNAQWYQAARVGDLQYIQENKHKYARTHDSRETNVNSDIFGGFAAIHYAAMYGQNEIVKDLLPLEFTMLTKNLISVNCPGFSENVKFKIQPQSTCLSVALLRNQCEVAQTIFDYLNQNSNKKAEFITASQGLSFNTYMVASLCENCPVSQKIIDDEMFIDKELAASKKGEITASMNGAYFFRLPVTLKLKQLVDESKKMDEISEILLGVDNGGNTAMQCALKAEVNVDQFQVKRENIQKIQQIFTIITKRAYEYAKNSSNENLKKLAEEFAKKNDVTTVFGSGDANKKDDDEQVDPKSDSENSDDAKSKPNDAKDDAEASN